MIVPGYKEEDLNVAFERLYQNRPEQNGKDCQGGKDQRDHVSAN